MEGGGPTDGEQQLQGNVGEDVDADLLALGLGVPQARPVRQAGREDLLDDLRRVLHNGLLLLLAAGVHHRPELAREVGPLVKRHRQLG